jgi:peptidoglycan/LPS O-acetylase OafA/YrhL
MKAVERRYDIDWLRVIAIGLLLVYHIGIGFQPWGVFIGFIQSNQPLASLWAPMSMLNIWRIPLLFFVSGMGVCFAMAKRNWKQLLLERSRRILLPFVFGALVIVPLHLLIWQRYYSQDLKYVPGPGHLWFLGNIFIYVLVLSPLFFYLKNNEEGKLGIWIRRLFGHPLGMLVIAGFFVLEALLVQSETYATFALNLHGLLVGFLAFLFGFLIVYSGEKFWTMAAKWKWALLALAALLFAMRLKVFHLEAPRSYTAIESCVWIFAVFGLANSYLKKPGRTLKYLSSAAYPVYILHMVFLYLGSSLFFPMQIPPVLQFILVTVFTFTGCFGFFELIRRVRALRPLFGLKKAVRDHSAEALSQPPVKTASSFV